MKRFLASPTRLLALLAALGLGGSLVWSATRCAQTDCCCPPEVAGGPACCCR